MNAVFIHDHCFVVHPSGEIHSTGKLSYGAWKHYLNVFASLVVVGRSRTAPKEALAAMNLASGNRVSFVFAPNLTGSWLGFRHLSAVVQILREQIGNADAVIIRTSLLGGIAASIARKMGKPYAVEVVGDAWDAYWNYGGLGGKLYAPIAWWTMRRCLQKAEFAIYVTHEYLQRRYPCPGICTSASDVELRPASGEVLVRRVSKPWPTDADGSGRPWVGLIGSLANRHKGLDVALRALRRLKARGVMLELHVLGAGRLEYWRRKAERLGVADLLCLDGSLPIGEAVMQWLDRMDIYIQPSFTEGMPRALIEAMSRGLPALASACGGIPELLPAKCLHRQGDDRTLAEQLGQMVTHSAWRRECAEQNFREAQSYYIDEIQARRDDFWSRFAKHAMERKP